MAVKAAPNKALINLVKLAKVYIIAFHVLNCYTGILNYQVTRSPRDH